MPRFHILALVALALSAVATAAPLSAADLEIRVEGVENSRGDIRLTLFAGDDFLDFGRVLVRVVEPAQVGSVTLRLSGLAPGAYAFSLAHDENGNGTLDRNFLGIPKEGVAVSNDARGFLGPPSAEDATFDLLGPETRQVVQLVYF